MLEGVNIPLYQGNRTQMIVGMNHNQVMYLWELRQGPESSLSKLVSDVSLIFSLNPSPSSLTEIIYCDEKLNVGGADELQTFAMLNT